MKMVQIIMMLYNITKEIIRTLDGHTDFFVILLESSENIY